MTSKQIRQQFLDFFAAKAHEIVPSSSVVPVDDPTLMFANAGMNQFKDVFLGTGSRDYSRAADTQKCIRAGGKHNDLDDVGQDTYHHTFFEMLGNWSFGDYFKKEAILWAWELLTEVWGIDRDRLHVTYFEGDEAEGLEPDTEAAELWRTVTNINPEHIHPGNKKDNFWEMGDTGPCGPCSEVHIDLTPDKSGGPLVNAGDARVIEIWNLVFIQYNRAGDGKLSPLPAKHVDTGMGFERICAVLQGMERGELPTTTNYDTDVFTPIFDAIQRRTGAPPYAGTMPGEAPPVPPASACAAPSDATRSSAPGPPSGPKPTDQRASRDQEMVDVSYRVIADHIRCLVFALTDGAIPSNEGRGYVLRRILRRAVRFGRQHMNMTTPFLADLVVPLVDHMGDFFPELREAHGGKNVTHVTELIHDEEDSFGRTFDRGLKLYHAAAKDARENHEGRIGGDAAFRLHDTFGFTIDLTELMAAEDGLTVDLVEYERLMEEARAKARGGGADADDLEQLAAEEFTKVGTCDDSFKYMTIPKCDALIKTIARNSPDGSNAAAGVGDVVLFSTDHTCFYAEQGGQVSDVGIAKTAHGGEVRVTGVRRMGDRILHTGTVVAGEFGSGHPCSMAVDLSFRIPTMQNHTSTHILNWALREVLGDHVQQKGSLVDPEKTRFDFSHHKPVTPDELLRIETLCNEQITANHTVYTAEVDQAKARKINTLRAVFGEKYPDVVRVVSIGADIGEMLADPENEKWMAHSVEFCGGTHLKASGEAERFVLTTEEGVAKGIRRIVGVSGAAAEVAESLGAALLAEANALTGAPSDDSEENSLSERIVALQKRLADVVIPWRTRHEIWEAIAAAQKAAKSQEKVAASASAAVVMEAVAGLLEAAVEVGGVKIVTGAVPSAKSDALRGAVDWIRNKTEASAVLLACADDSKVTLLAGMSKVVVVRGVKAGDLIKEIAPLVGGKGGGRPDMAQGGGNDPGAVPEAIARARSWLEEQLA